MSRDDADPRPTAPARVSVANPRRTRLALERLRSEQERSDR